jgi:hypothetical protein
MPAPGPRRPTRCPGSRSRSAGCAWSATALSAQDGRLDLDPCLPDEIGEVIIDGLYAFGTRWHIEAIGSNGHIRLAR